MSYQIIADLRCPMVQQQLFTDDDCRDEQLRLAAHVESRLMR